MHEIEILSDIIAKNGTVKFFKLSNIILMENINYQHFLITRFNLKQDSWVNDKHSTPLFGASDNWLKKRFELFEDFCLPSVKSQSNKNFKWLVYFSTDTSDTYKEKIRSIQLDFPNFLPKFIPGMNELVNSIKSDIKIECNDFNNSIIITTRLDNDDALHENFINNIQIFIFHHHITKGVLDMPYGFCLKVEPPLVLSSTIQFSNAFITYIEPYISTSSLLTVFAKEHPKWVYSDKTYFLNKKRLWMQIIHENNVLNEIQGLLLNDTNFLKDFNFKDEICLPKLNHSKILYHRYLKGPIYYLKKILKKIWIKRRLILN